jgi:hypothetical protein
MAIDHCDFPKAQAIDCHLDRLKEELAFATSKAGHVEIQFLLDLKKEAIRVKAAAALRKAHDAASEVQGAFQNRLIELFGAHTREPKALSDRYTESLELELMRIVPDAIRLKKQARSSAKNRDYSLADVLSQQSNEASRKQIEKKQEAAKQFFDSKKERMKARHEQEREAVKEKLDRDLETIHHELNVAKKRYKANLCTTTTISA